MSVTRKVCIEYINPKGEPKQFFRGDKVGVIVGDDIFVGRLTEIWVDYLMIDCSVDFKSNIQSIPLKDIDEVVNYDDYKDIQPLEGI